MKRYSGLRQSKIVACIEEALRECGAEILVPADPTTAPFNTSDLEAARAQRWHGWERERFDVRRSVRPEESLLTETVIAFRADQFLRYVEFERMACGLDCGERCRLSDRIERGLSQREAPRSAHGKHSLEVQLGLPASDILDMVMARIGGE